MISWRRFRWPYPVLATSVRTDRGGKTGWITDEYVEAIHRSPRRANEETIAGSDAVNYNSIPSATQRICHGAGAGERDCHRCLPAQFPSTGCYLQRVVGFGQCAGVATGDAKVALLVFAECREVSAPPRSKRSWPIAPVRSIPEWCCSLTTSDRPNAMRPNELRAGSSISSRKSRTPPNVPPVRLCVMSVAPLVARTATPCRVRSYGLVVTESCAPLIAEHERLTVADVDIHAAVVLFDNAYVDVSGELIEQPVALVEQVIGRLTGAGKTGGDLGSAARCSVRAW